MILLRLISWPYMRRHLLRTALTVAGIVLGVAVFVGMHSANRSVLGSFSRSVDKIAGAAQLQVTAGETGFDEEVLERVQSLRSVRVAVPVIEAAVSSGLPGQGNLLILGVDFTGDRSLRDYDLESGDDAVIEDPLVFLAQPDSLMVTAEFARRARLDINSRLALGTVEGRREFVVRGIMRPGGMSGAFGGNLAVMDIYAAQKMLGRGRKFDRLDLAAPEGVTVERVRDEVRDLLGPGFTVEPPSARGAQFEAMVEGMSITVNITSVFALVIGAFIIYNSFAIAVTQRRYEIGVLRALGATRRQIRALFLAESAAAGALGSVGGVGAGYLLARFIMGTLSGLVEGGYGVDQAPPELRVEPWLMAASIATGMLTSVVAALVPAQDAARVDPVLALQKGKLHEITSGEARARHRAAAWLAVAALAAVAAGWSRPMLFYAGFGLTIMAAVALTPTLALWIARLLRPALQRLRPVEGSLAADSLIHAPRRTSATVAALMLSLALVVEFGGVARSFYVEMSDWMRTAFNPDLFVTTSESLASRTFRFPAEIGEGIKTLDGVDTVQMVRLPRINWRGGPILLVAVEIASVARTAWRKPLAGDGDTMYQVAAAGKGLIASDNLALLHRLKLGDEVELAAPGGVLKLPIVGIVVDYSDQLGSFLIDRELYKKYWHDDTANIFRVYVKPGVSPAQVRQAILDRYGARARLFVLSNAEVRRYVERIIDQWFAMSHTQIYVSVFVAILGIVNTLTVSITDRRRELGVLQAVGALRNQVRHTIWMEALSIGAIGLALGLAMGAIYIVFALLTLHHHLAGVRLGFQYPFETAGLLVVVMLAAAFVSSLGPAEAAVRGSLVEALEYE